MDAAFARIRPSRVQAQPPHVLSTERKCRSEDQCLLSQRVTAVLGLCREDSTHPGLSWPHSLHPHSFLKTRRVTTPEPRKFSEIYTKEDCVCTAVPFLSGVVSVSEVHVLLLAFPSAHHRTVYSLSKDRKAATGQGSKHGVHAASLR